MLRILVRVLEPERAGKKTETNGRSRLRSTDAAVLVVVVFFCASSVAPEIDADEEVDDALTDWEFTWIAYGRRCELFIRGPPTIAGI